MKLISPQSVEVIHLGLGLTGPYPNPTDVFPSTHLCLLVGTENSGCCVQRPSSVSFKLEFKTDGAPCWHWPSAHSHSCSRHPCVLAVIWPHVQISRISLVWSVLYPLPVTCCLWFYAEITVSGWGQQRGIGRVSASLISKTWAWIEIRVNE